MAALATLALGAMAFSLMLAVATPLWLDETHTHWLVRDGFFPLLGRLHEDVHPPLFFCLEYGVERWLGMAPWALRLLPAVAAGATVVAAYWVARPFARRAWALAAAALFATHPLLLFYGFVARNYALFTLLLVVAFGATIRCARPDAKRRDWMVLAALLVLLVNTHNLAIFCFPSLLGAGIWLAGREWRAIAWRLLGVQAVAFATCLPWFLLAARAEGGVAWVAAFWRRSEKWSLLWHSLQGFGFGAHYPAYLGPVGAVEGLPVVGAALTVLLLAAALIRPAPVAAGAPPVAASGHGLGPALWIGAGSLVLLWLYSVLRQPIYLVGRYDLVAFPFVIFLLWHGAQALGARLRRPAVGVGLLTVGVAINVYASAQLWSRRNVVVPDQLGRVVDFMANHGAGQGDLVVTRGGSAFQMLYYGADRAGLRWEFVSFPLESARHPGWYNAAIFLRDRPRLQQDAAVVRRQVVEALASGRRVWVVGVGEANVDEYLMLQLMPVTQPDWNNSSDAGHVVTLLPR